MHAYIRPLLALMIQNTHMYAGQRDDWVVRPAKRVSIINTYEYMLGVCVSVFCLNAVLHTHKHTRVRLSLRLLCVRNNMHVMHARGHRAESKNLLI